MFTTMCWKSQDLIIEVAFFGRSPLFWFFFLLPLCVDDISSLMSSSLLLSRLFMSCDLWFKLLLFLLLFVLFFLLLLFITSLPMSKLFFTSLPICERGVDP